MYPNGWHVSRSGDDVVGHLAVLHAPFVPNHFLVQGEADALRYPAHNLSRCQNWMKDLSHLLKRHEVIHRYTVGDGIDRHFCHINSPGKSRVCRSAIFLLIPDYAFGLLVPRKASKSAVFLNMRPACSAKLLRRIRVSDLPARL